MFKTVACGWEKPGRTRFFWFSNQTQNPKTVFFLDLVEIHIAKGFLFPCTHIHYYLPKRYFSTILLKFSFTPAFTELGFCLYSECASFNPEFQVTSINLQIFIFSVYLNLLRERFNSRSLSYVQVQSAQNNKQLTAKTFDQLINIDGGRLRELLECCH